MLEDRDKNNIKTTWENLVYNEEFNPFDTPKCTHFSAQVGQNISLQVNTKPTSVKVEQ